MPFIRQLEKRNPIGPLLSACSNLFTTDAANNRKFRDSLFKDLLRFVEEGEESFQAVAVQAAAKWSDSAQKVLLRNSIVRRGFRTPSCLWAYVKLRGNSEELFKDYASPEVTLMQIMLLKETEPGRAILYLVERFLSRPEISDELRAASELCTLRLLDSNDSPELLRSFQVSFSKS